MRCWWPQTHLHWGIDPYIGTLTPFPVQLWIETLISHWEVDFFFSLSIWTLSTIQPWIKTLVFILGLWSIHSISHSFVTSTGCQFLCWWLGSLLFFLFLPLFPMWRPRIPFNLHSWMLTHPPASITLFFLPPWLQLSSIVISQIKRAQWSRGSSIAYWKVHRLWSHEFKSWSSPITSLSFFSFQVGIYGYLLFRFPLRLKEKMYIRDRMGHGA